MHSALSTALLGLSALAAARPSNDNYNQGSSAASTTQYGWMSSKTTTSAPSGNTVFSFPLANGFPASLKADALQQIKSLAHGVPGNGAAPTGISADSATNFKFIAFNELTEVAFFSELINNITYNVPGYDQVPNREAVLAALTAVLAQEELHAIGAENALKANNIAPIAGCKYDFPVSSFDEAITTASLFTDVVLGTLPDVQKVFSKDGVIGGIQLVGSVIGQEGEQNGYYRTLENKIPSALPFLTAGKREFAFSALVQNFVVRGSCDADEKSVGFKVFARLNTVNLPSPLKPINTTLSFEADNDNIWNGPLDQLNLVYINQQTLPIIVPLKNAKQGQKSFTFDADFPGDFPFFMNGLTIAVVVQNAALINGTIDKVPAQTLFGPALIEIN